MSIDKSHSDQVYKPSLEDEHIRLQNEKLAIEIQTIRAASPINPWEGRLARFVPAITALVAAGGLWFGIYQYIKTEENQLVQKKEADKTLQLDLKRETAKPLWSAQLNLYIEAAEVAATIATTTNIESRDKAEARFWVLYWGPLAAVEDVGLTKPQSPKIEAAMVRYGNLLSFSSDKRDSEALKKASLSLAHAIREALAPAFDVEMAELQDLRTKSDDK